MKVSRRMSLLKFLIASILIAQDAKVTPLISKDLAQYAFLYVLEGSVVMQLMAASHKVDVR